MKTTKRVKEMAFNAMERYSLNDENKDKQKRADDAIESFFNKKISQNDK